MPVQPLILFVGDNPTLEYLLNRYAQQSGLRIRVEPAGPAAAELSALQPAVVWFPSLESLEASQPRSANWVGDGTPLVVCLSIADETRARELGADYCVLQPFTYQDFLTALAAVGVATAERRTPASQAGDSSAA